MEGDKLFGFELSQFVFFGILLFMVLLIWESNRLLSDLVLNREVKKIHPLIILYVLSLLAVSLIAFFTTLGFVVFREESINEVLTFKLTIGFSFRVNLFLHCVNAIYYYVNRYKNVQLEAEILKKQNAEARFEALKNQISPHFLFNSFNVLSSLVYKDADTASKFIEQLSGVYRYLLNNQESRVVKLREELSFIDSYIFLLKIRFKNNLIIINSIDESLNDSYIAPVTLQLLIENAIKHNVVSRAEPLTIKLYNDTTHIIVENNIQLKEVKENSTNIGLKNLKERYNYLSGKDTLSVLSNGFFAVKIPLIAIE